MTMILILRRIFTNHDGPVHTHTLFVMGLSFNEDKPVKALVIRNTFRKFTFLHCYPCAECRVRTTTTTTVGDKFVAGMRMRSELIVHDEFFM